MNKIKNILFGAGLGLFFMVGILGTSCTKWTQPEAKDYYTPPTQAYKDNLKDYFNSPHKVMFGWFGNWAGEGGSMANSLMGLPDSVDFVSLWLCWGNINEAKQKVAMFNATYAEYTRNPEVPRIRMYYEMISKTLPGVKLYIDVSDTSTEKLLPLDEFASVN